MKEIKEKRKKISLTKMRQMCQTVLRGRERKEGKNKNEREVMRVTNGTVHLLPYFRFSDGKILEREREKMKMIQPCDKNNVSLNA